jgi:hypothetical protein
MSGKMASPVPACDLSGCESHSRNPRLLPPTRSSREGAPARARPRTVSCSVCRAQKGKGV